MTKKDLARLIKFWLESSERDWQVAADLIKQRHYPQGLFFVHLALEKRIKAMIIKQSGEHAPFSHNLEYLLGRAGFEVPESLIAKLKVISDFNISGRYPDEQESFAKKATKEFVVKWHTEAKKILRWLERQ